MRYTIIIKRKKAVVFGSPLFISQIRNDLKADHLSTVAKPGFSSGDNDL